MILLRVLLDAGSIGNLQDIWSKYELKDGEVVTIKLMDQSEALTSIKKKLLGEKLTYQDFYVVMSDIAIRKLK
jgi:alcohol dehydrogenase class IV